MNDLFTTPPKFDFENCPKYVAVVGSRDFKRKRWVSKFLEQLPDKTIVVSGGAPEGVDLWVKEYCDANARLHYKEFAVEDFEWKADGRPAGPDRNEHLIYYMVIKQRRQPTHTVVFANFDSNKGTYTPGSNNVILNCKKYKVPHTVYSFIV